MRKTKKHSSAGRSNRANLSLSRPGVDTSGSGGPPGGPPNSGPLVIGGPICGLSASGPVSGTGGAGGGGNGNGGNNGGGGGNQGEDLYTLEAEITELQRENARVESQVLRLRSDITAMENQLKHGDKVSQCKREKRAAEPRRYERSRCSVGTEYPAVGAEDMYQLLLMLLDEATTAATAAAVVNRYVISDIGNLSTDAQACVVYISLSLGLISPSLLLAGDS